MERRTKNDLSVSAADCNIHCRGDNRKDEYEVMTGKEAWQLLAPLLVAPDYRKDSPTTDKWIEAYVILNIGTTLFDNWVAHGKPEEWQDKPGKKKLCKDSDIQHVGYTPESMGYGK